MHHWRMTYPLTEWFGGGKFKGAGHAVHFGDGTDSNRCSPNSCSAGILT